MLPACAVPVDVSRAAPELPRLHVRLWSAGHCRRPWPHPARRGSLHRSGCDPGQAHTSCRCTCARTGPVWFSPQHIPSRSYSTETTDQRRPSGHCSTAACFPTAQSDGLADVFLRDINAALAWTRPDYTAARMVAELRCRPCRRGHAGRYRDQDSVAACHGLPAVADRAWRDRAVLSRCATGHPGSAYVAVLGWMEDGRLSET